MSCANQITLLICSGAHWIRPSNGSRVTLVPGWLARRLGALNDALMVARRLIVPPPVGMEYRWYPVPGTEETQNVVVVACIGLPPTTTGSVEPSTAKAVKVKPDPT